MNWQERRTEKGLCHEVEAGRRNERFRDSVALHGSSHGSRVRGGRGGKRQEAAGAVDLQEAV